MGLENARWEVSRGMFGKRVLRILLRLVRRSNLARRRSESRRHDIPLTSTDSPCESTPVRKESLGMLPEVQMGHLENCPLDLLHDYSYIRGYMQSLHGHADRQRPG